MTILLAILLTLPSPAPGNAAQPFLFASRDSVLMSWLEPGALRFARFRNGAWTEARTIVAREELLASWADFPSIVEDRNGVLYAHWLQKNSAGGYACDVWFSTSRDGGKTWREPVLLNRDGVKSEHGFASLVPLPDGGVAVAWLDGRTPEMMLRYATIDARGTVANETQLDARTCECCSTGMTMTPGGAVITYRDRSAGEVRDIAVIRRTSKGWTAPRVVHADGWMIKGCPVNGPQVDAIGNRVAAAWFNGGGEHVQVAFSDDGGATFAPPIVLDGGKPTGRVDIVLADRETAVVTWIEANAVRARVVHRNGAMEPGIKVADAPAKGFPRIARYGSDVFVAWPGASGIQAARLALRSSR
ncbi:MAG TPA: sialidase family protein [Thermoanaerobaculia bacterium]|nr:sialidase family protein [Thermoanaerobaculia bacterium]